MKKIICTILAAMLFVTVISFAASAANGATVYVTASETNVCAGDTVVVTVSIANNPGYLGFSFLLPIPQGFEYISHQVGASAPSTLQYNPANGFVNCASANPVTGDGVLLTINLKVTATTTTTAVFALSNVKMSASDLSDIPTTPVVSAPVVAGHVDVNKDHVCDQPGCGAQIGEHADSLTDRDHNCEYCGQKIGDCTDLPFDGDHLCEICGAVVSACFDTNFDHYCDECGSYEGVHVVTDKSHYCLICGLYISACYDYDNDHLCDACGAVTSDCIDKLPLDGYCDVCYKELVHRHKLVYTAAVEATCFEQGNLEYWYCAGCDCYFTDAEGKYNIARLSLITPVAHKIEHVAAKAPTATENGNIEYWYCTECGYAWLDELCTKNTNLKAVILPATGEPEHKHELVHTEAKAATCFEQGNLEYWYCAGCDCYFTDAEGKYNIARLSLITPVAHKVEHVAAKAATCFEEGNIEYWYCTECGYAWLDELCTKNTNLKAVILPVSHKIVHVEAKAPTATEEGNIEYWYCTECGYAWLDELCIFNTNLKAVILPATGEVINPPTGDASILYIAAVAVIATLGVAVISFKKREEN